MKTSVLPPSRCARCSNTPADRLAWRCACGGAFEYDWQPCFDPAWIDQSQWSQWRYRKMLVPPGIDDVHRVTLGEGMTPLCRVDLLGTSVLVKLEYLMPTGSYKDRGTTTLVTILRAEGIGEVVEDSSGNAGASIAAYAAAAGLQATIFVPVHASPGKKRQIAAMGATLQEIAGPRAAAGDACHEAARSTVYASHAWHPAFLLGQCTAAWELWEQTAGRLPDAVVVPCGQGGLLLGYYRGFRALQAAGLIGRMPCLVAVQSAHCAPLVQAWEQGAATVERVREQATVAEGIRIGYPARGDEMLRAVRASDGFALVVDDEEIRVARAALARRGLFVEATSAVPVAALPQVRQRIGPDAQVLIPLSGSGLKAMC